MTISDSGSRGDRNDLSGDVAFELVSREDLDCIRRTIVPDDRGTISETLREWCDSGEFDFVLTTGGTGLGPRDITPEATRDVIELEIPGISEAIRNQTFKQTPFAVLSRAVAGVRSRCLIINLPGSPKGVRESLEVVLPVIPHALQIIKGSQLHI